MPSFISTITFRYLNSFFQVASKKVLEVEDCPDLPEKCSSVKNGSLIKALWATSPPRSLTQSLIKIYWLEYCCIGLILGASSCLSFGGPVLLHRLIVCAETNAATSEIALNGLALFVCRLTVSILSTQYTYRAGLIGVSIASGLKSCLYQKTLRLSTNSRRQYTAGNISNLYTVDIESSGGSKGDT